MKIVRTGLSPWQAVRMGIVNKTFDVFEKEIVEDVVRTRIPQRLDTGRCLWRIRKTNL